MRQTGQRRNRLVAVLVACALVPAASALGRASTPEPDVRPDATEQGLRVPYVLFRLPNGLTVILHEDHSIPRISVNAWYHVGSGREEPGRTGFAHLFEHLMFEGSAHVPEGAFDNWLEAVGADNNGSTTEDRTNYWENLPSNALDLALFLESDRMGYLLEALSPERVDGQRDVVKNERRQSYENRPYGMADLLLPGAIFPKGHPYSWPVIGSMEDLSAASYEDAAGFFKRYYHPGNVSLAIAGDIDPAAARTAVEKWFSDVPAGQAVRPVSAPAVILDGEKRYVLFDRVQLPKLLLAWPSAAAFAPSDAALEVLADVLSRGKNSRLYRSLVYELQIAQEVDAYQDGRKYGGMFAIEITARPGHGLDEILEVVDAQVASVRERVRPREVQRAVNGIEARFLDSLDRIGGFDGKADRLNYYWFYAGNPDYFAEDLARYRALDASDIQAAAIRWLGTGRVAVSVVPEGSPELAVSGSAPAEAGPESAPAKEGEPS